MKYYITFSPLHRREIAGKVYDKDCVCIFESDTHLNALTITQQYFGNKFCAMYSENEWKKREDEGIMDHFRRGYVQLIPVGPAKLTDTILQCADNWLSRQSGGEDGEDTLHVLNIEGNQLLTVLDRLTGWGNGTIRDIETGHTASNGSFFFVTSFDIREHPALTVAEAIALVKEKSVGHVYKGTK